MKAIIIILAIVLSGCAHRPEPLEETIIVRVPSMIVFVEPPGSVIFEGRQARGVARRITFADPKLAPILHIVVEGWVDEDGLIVLKQRVTGHEFIHHLNWADPRFKNPDAYQPKDFDLR